MYIQYIFVFTLIFINNFIFLWKKYTGFRHLLFFVNSKNPVFKPFVAYFFVNFLNFICCTELYFYEKRAII